MKSLYPDKADVVVTSQDKLMYKHLIMAMDLLLASGFSGISIATGESDLMPIHVPGFRHRRSNKIQMTKRNVVAVLQLTAMVDLFTVLVVFLLQNYASTNQILPISESVVLPKATSTDQLNPSFVVVLVQRKTIL